MSYGPPPGPSEQSGPPPGGGYGPPTGYGSAPSSGAKIDPKSASPLDWAAAGAGVLALIFSFFAFYTYDAKGQAKEACSAAGSQVPPVLKPLCSGDSASAWHGFFGWF